jgi:regulation of enolase protein 1 (concanavalin A-like superfamily)
MLPVHFRSGVTVAKQLRRWGVLVAGGCALAAVVPISAAVESPAAKASPSADSPGVASLRDDFQGKFALQWTVVRPDKSHFSLTKNPGHLTIKTQRGSIHGDQDHDPLTQGIRAKNIFLIPNPLSGAGDFSMTLAVGKFQPTMFFQQVGLICYDDDDNYVKWSYEYSWAKADTTNFVMVRETKMEPKHDLVVELPNPGRFWMRVTKRGNEYECAYSTDGRNFKVAGSRPWGEKPTEYLGFLAKNGGNPRAGEIDVCIDSFELRALGAAGGKSPGDDAPRAYLAPFADLAKGYSVQPAPLSATPAERARRTAVLRVFRQLAEEVKIRPGENAKSPPVEMLPEPLYRYADPAHDCPDATVWAWGRAGRPVALLTLAIHLSDDDRHLAYKFDSLSANPLLGQVADAGRWTPRAPGMDMKPWDGAPPPGDTKEERLRQMQELLRHLAAVECLTDEKDSASKGEKHELRWLPNPVHRYAAPEQRVLDGAIFLGFAGTSPVLLLVVEARGGGDSEPGWQFGFNRMTLAELRVQMEGKDLWTAPSLSKASDTDAYWTMARPLPGE